MKRNSFLIIGAWGLIGIGYLYFLPQMPETSQPMPHGPLPKPRVVNPAPIPPPSSETGRETWPALDDMGEVAVRVGPRQNAVGTAFAVGEDGVWITARHVIDGCSKVGLAIGRDVPGQQRRFTRADDFKWHPNADIGIITSKSSGPRLEIKDGRFDAGLSGYHFGYPQGKPAAVRSLLIGQTRLRSDGRYSTREKALVWASSERRPAFTGTLGGISGGPVLDGNGQVIGVTVASSKRRGRIITTTPDTMRDMLARGRHPTHPGSSRKLWQASIDKINFDAVGQQARDEMAVTQVACVAE
ncbi:trypsin-like peptidase domain-containing protein [Aestuariispira insulae]|uniref:Trypsin-like peptidase n=1 Tax=Aestuariispira insulae TaxID=1461337 RepID=A0A3D9HY34_9PROT|nr:trypsin-like peptidase domain-containing protein [Aestuariispira insulae]RED54330.1 trypsin-like peptidase [Aestuariispira insulae]